MPHAYETFSLVNQKNKVTKKQNATPFDMDVEGNARNYKGLGAFRGHFGAPPASRRAAQGAFSIGIWENILVKLIF